MSRKATSWIMAHPDHVGVALCQPMLSRLEGIRDGLARHGYDLRLDIGKRTTKGVVSSKTFRSKSTYPTLASFIWWQEARVAALDARAATPVQAVEAGQ